MTIAYFCCDENRRAALRQLNGIDSVLVEPAGSPTTAALAGRSGEVILVRALRPLSAPFTRENVRVQTPDGRAVQVLNAAPAAGTGVILADAENYLYVVVRPGALSGALGYTLSLAASASDATPPPGFRPALSRVTFFATPRGVTQPTTNTAARKLVLDLNGIDYLEVLDADAPPGLRQRVLRVHFIRRFSPVPAGFSHENVTIKGGERVRDVRVVPPVKFLADDLLEVVVNKPGDFSTYTLALVEPNGEPLKLLDPLLSAVDFSFKVDCDSKFDCRPECVCPPEPPSEPELNYLAKDYNSFRRLMLDRMSVVSPQWEGRNTADLGIALVELLAYVGDYLSYRQDAVATESYLGTARRRASVRRHARLVDYFMHDGCNARVWAQVQADTEGVTLPAGTRLLTRVPRLDDAVLDDAAYERALLARPVIFETMHEATLYESLNELDFYAWGEDECCLPQAATRATLDGKLVHLKKGDVLVFKEALGPLTGEEEDADLRHRHAVRLTAVRFSADPLFTDPADPDSPRPVTEIEWSGEDALPFPLCISSVREEDEQPLARVSVALGNIVLADHGLTVEDEEMPAVPAADTRLTPASDAPCERCGGQRAGAVAHARYRPRLSRSPLTMAAGIVVETGEGATERRKFDSSASASAAFRWEMRQVLPEIELAQGVEPWEVRRDLLSSDEFAPDFVAEVEEDGYATLRFGDDEYGLRPSEGDTFKATYRVGNGTGGNVGADALAHAVTTVAGVSAVGNPLPAQGGVEAESIEHVRRSAPFAFRTQERAVTPEDYAAVAERHPEVQRAAATMRWTGSWRTVFLTVDRAGGLPVTEEFELEMLRHLERYRMAGHDVEVDAPRFVPLEIVIHVCVEPGYFRSNVERALLEVFSSGTRPDGRRGFFHPDNFTFGQSVHLSPVVAAAQTVEGVRFVSVLTFQRLGTDTAGYIAAGLLDIGRLEIARLDNDPNFPERGALNFELEGGR